MSDNRLQHSPYLSSLIERFGLPPAAPEIQLNELTKAAARPGTQSEDLPKLKAQFALNYAATDFSSFDASGAALSSFADVTLARALRLAWEKAAKRHRIELPELAEGEAVPGLFLLGLGKLGGYDLNFSSDVDLIAFYDPERLPVPKSKGQSYIAGDVCKMMTQILNPRHAPDFVWRVDWRLRPESSGTGLALSIDKAEQFYFFRALPWHRLALMKARVVAGDLYAGHKFLDDMAPFIWRRNLDFTTLDELAALKTRINDEHPGLQAERSAPDPITPGAAGFNVKLGRGGIREIEFVANAQQLVRGGKVPSLRTTNTRKALLSLSEAGLFPAEDAQDMREIYQRFRRIENAIQMLENAHTHIVPDTKDQQAALLGLLEQDDWDEFCAQIYADRQRVNARFDTLFKAQAKPVLENTPKENTPKENTSTSTEKTEADASETNMGGETRSTQISTSWADGFTEHGLPRSSQVKFQQLGADLAARVQAYGDEEAFIRVDNFLQKLSLSEQYFELLARHSYLLDRMIAPLLHSPHMSEILAQSPHIIDVFLQPDNAPLSEQSAFVLSASDYGRRLEALRRFVNEQLFKAYTRFLDGTDKAEDLQAQLTAIAEETLTLSIRIVADDLNVAELPMSVLGLGKMGTAKMAPQSDLDLIFIFADDCDPDLSAKAVRRLRTTLTTRLGEGIAYDLDMRLRPSGRSGPPAVKLAAFYDHHMTRAHSWEHIALAPARIVAGDTELGAQVMAAKSDILTRPRDLDEFWKDAKDMFTRITTERVIKTPPDILRSKLREGGLMQADFLISAFDVAHHEIPDKLEAATQRWRKLQIWQRLLNLSGQPISAVPERYRERIGVKTLKDRMAEAEQIVRAATHQAFDKVTLPEGHEFTSVRWADG